MSRRLKQIYGRSAGMASPFTVKNFIMGGCHCGARLGWDGSYFVALGCHGPVQRSSLVDAEARKSLLLPASKEILASLFGI